ncbi:MAG: aldehyde dehydrogenase family protein, partial [Tissierellia bacterium]|nr:aldehyde dehydrogenase family protein [Tissierellia bacterium]
MKKIETFIQKQKAYFQKGETKKISFRIHQLKRLKEGVLNYEEEILEALKKDLNKSEFEAYMTEIGMVLQEINYTIKNLKAWAKPEKVKSPMVHFPVQSFLYKEPYGQVLILSPWNYPFQLCISPLVGAIAAGNCVTIKPSELAPNTSKVIAKILNNLYPVSYVAVVQGGVEVSQKLLEKKWDYIFYTGSTRVGHLVMEAAAKNLTPITLELGGKSPCIVDEEACIDLAAKRIIWGKLFNAGQTCVAPDYILVHQSVKDQLVESMKKYIFQFYGEGININFPRIINEGHFRRLQGLMKNGRVLVGGHYDEDKLQISPTIIDQISIEEPIMKEEIFGPLLPIMTYEQWDEVKDLIENKGKPLAVYYFSENEE